MKLIINQAAIFYYCLWGFVFHNPTSLVLSASFVVAFTTFDLLD